MNAAFQAMPRAIASLANSASARTRLRFGAGLGVLAVASLAQPALAADECGAAPAGGTVTCVAANNPYAGGIIYAAPTGPLTVVLNADTVVNTPAANGVEVNTAGQNLTVTAAAGSSVTTAANNSYGYLLNSGAGTINATTGTVRTTGVNAIGVGALGSTGNLTLIARDTGTTGAGSVGLLGQTTTGALNITTGTVSTTGTGATAVLASSTSGNVTVTGTGSTVSTTGESSTGIGVTTGGAGIVNVTGGTTTTTGNNSIGIQASNGSGNLTVTTGTVNTTGANSIGVYASSTTGNVQVNGGTVGTQGAGAYGVIAQTGGAGTSTITGGNITTVGAGALGAYASSVTGAANASVTSATTSGASAYGVYALSTGGAATAGATTVSTSGTDAFGILVNGATGATANYGNVTTTGAGAGGVFVTAGGGATGATVLTGATTGLVSTTGANANGIYATGPAGVTITTGRVSATGAGSIGILTSASGGAVNVTSTGVVANGNGVQATNTGGAASVTLSGTNNSVTGSGAVVNGSTTAALTLTGGTLNGAVNGATLTSGTTSSVTNSGTISGTVAAIDATGGGTATITNNAAGIINGRIALGAGNDVVNNAGTFNASAVSNLGAGSDTFTNSGTFNATAASIDFGTGANDVFNNSGTLNVRPGAVVTGTFTTTGLDAFNNTGGLIDLRNGLAGDVLDLGTAGYVGSGNARLAVDANFNIPVTTSDRLVTTGAATGSTAVIVNRLATPAILSTAAGTTFATAGVGTSANAFVIDPGSQVDGVIQYGVVFNAGTNSFALVSAPSAAAYRTALFGDGVRNLWLQSGDAWTAHMRETRDNIAANGPGGAGGRFWFQGYGNWEKRTSGRTVTYNGITSQVDLGYDQDYYGLQLGLDLGTPVGPKGGFNFGVTGGYQSSNMSFNAAAADAIRFNSVNGGLYASFNSGIFFVNALAKYDYYWGETRSPAGLYGFDISGGVWGAKAEAGLRFGGAFWVEPAVSVSWTNSDFDDFVVPSGTFAINDEDGLRGKAGARLGYTTDWGAAKVSLYGGANYVREFRGRSDVVFTSGGQTAAFRSPYNADYVEGLLGVNVGSSAGKLSGFFEGRYADGRDYDGYGVRGGVRVRF